MASKTSLPSLWADALLKRTHVVTIWGWTPGIRMLVGQHHLECGCWAGVYELFCGELLEIIDIAHDGCTLGHDPNRLVAREGLGDTDKNPD